MSPVGIEPTISAGERPQTYALDSAATGTGKDRTYSWCNERCTFGRESPRNGQL